MVIKRKGGNEVGRVERRKTEREKKKFILRELKWNKHWRHHGFELLYRTAKINFYFYCSMLPILWSFVSLSIKTPNEFAFKIQPAFFIDFY